MSNRKSQARTKADSEQKAEDLFVSQHSRKPNVACSFSSPGMKNNRQEYGVENWSDIISQFKDAYDVAAKTSSTMSRSGLNDERSNS